jgi:ribonuclease BN (tRNA processing enzyme)
VNGVLLVDAGTAGAVLDDGEAARIGAVLLTHAHFDHVRGLPTLLDRRIFSGGALPLPVLSCREALSVLRRHLFNGSLWPDFTVLPAGRPALSLLPLPRLAEAVVCGHRVRAERVSHTVPTIGFLVTDPDGRTAAFTGDTGPTERFWRLLDGVRVDVLVTEVTFPDRLEETALRTGHLTARLLSRELGKLRTLPGQVLLGHVKDPFLPEVEREVASLGLPGLRLLREGETIRG